MAKPNSIDEYFADLSPEQRAVMEQVRTAIRQAAPDATEAFSYRMPAFKLHGRSLVWYAAFADHYSMFPATDGLREQLGDRLAGHLAGKGTIRFDARKPIPVELIADIVAARRAELEG
jgi:uncharacterized protein YdhG (YjbR/CyaY superfamily)